MRFLITLTAHSANTVIPINYPYCLSAVIYRILAQADQSYAEFLHEVGYRSNSSLKTFKFFTFSDLQVPFYIKGDRLCLKSPKAQFQVCFHLPEAAENFIKGLFKNQQIDIADQKSGGTFTIEQVEALSDTLPDMEHPEIIVRPMSPLVCGQKNDQGNYDFLSPEHPDFISQLRYNWKEKCKAIYELV